MITYSNENADALLDSLNDNIGIPEFKNRLNEVYLSSDFHILKEFIQRNEDGSKTLLPYHPPRYFVERQLRIIGQCARIKNHPFIFLGDLTESEFEEDSPYIKEVTEFYKNILKTDDKSPRILVRGNNDCLSKEAYYKMGFDYVVSKLELGPLFFTHKPTNVDDKHINLHGHLHESTNYYDISPRNHINVYWETNNGPQTIETFLKWFKNGKYDNNEIKFSEEFKLCDQILDNGVNYE